MLAGQILQGGQDIINQQVFFIQLVCRVINDRISRPGSNSLLSKSVRVKLVAFQCKKRLPAAIFLVSVLIVGWVR